MTSSLLAAIVGASLAPALAAALVVAAAVAAGDLSRRGPEAPPPTAQMADEP